MKQVMDAMYQQHYSDMPREQFDQMCGCCERPTHDDLDGAAVTGQDSMDLQDMDPSVKPAVKMTVDQLLQHMDRIEGKVVVIWDGAAYIMDPHTLDPSEAINDILTGDDSEILGYPEKGGEDAAVTKQGEVVTHLPTMKEHAQNGNLAWAASGDGADLMNKARAVAQAIQTKGR